MNSKQAMAILVEYFIEKGKVLSWAEYKKEEDVPIKPVKFRIMEVPYSKLVRMLPRSLPDKYALIGKKEEPVKVELPKKVYVKKEVEAKDE